MAAALATSNRGSKDRQSIYFGLALCLFIALAAAGSIYAYHETHVAAPQRFKEFSEKHFDQMKMMSARHLKNVGSRNIERDIRLPSIVVWNGDGVQLPHGERMTFLLERPLTHFRVTMEFPNKRTSVIAYPDYVRTGSMDWAYFGSVDLEPHVGVPVTLHILRADRYSIHFTYRYNDQP